jgi:hypothetical protein
MTCPIDESRKNEEESKEAAMSCCGQRRQAHKAWLAPRPVRMRFVGTGAMEARGAVTGRTYAASERAPDIDVDARDARELVKSGQFEVAR